MFSRVLLATAFAISLAACEEDGAVERFGESVDEAAGQIQDAARDAGDAISDTARDIGNRIEDACEDATDADC